MLKYESEKRISAEKALNHFLEVLVKKQAPNLLKLKPVKMDQKAFSDKKKWKEFFLILYWIQFQIQNDFECFIKEFSFVYMSFH